MIRKTQFDFKRLVSTWNNGGKDTHTERVRRDTWWLLGFIPLYSRDTIVSTSL